MLLIQHQCSCLYIHTLLNRIKLINTNIIQLEILLLIKNRKTVHKNRQTNTELLL